MNDFLNILRHNIGSGVRTLIRKAFFNINVMISNFIVEITFAPAVSGDYSRPF